MQCSGGWWGDAVESSEREVDGYSEENHGGMGAGVQRMCVVPEFVVTTWTASGACVSALWKRSGQAVRRKKDERDKRKTRDSRLEETRTLNLRPALARPSSILPSGTRCRKGMLRLI
jgi:hypothetical protein